MSSTNEKLETLLRNKLIEKGITDKARQDRIIAELNAFSVMVINNFIQSKYATTKGGR